MLIPIHQHKHHTSFSLWAKPRLSQFKAAVLDSKAQYLLRGQRPSDTVAQVSNLAFLDMLEERPSPMATLGLCTPRVLKNAKLTLFSLVLHTWRLQTPPHREYNT